MRETGNWREMLGEREREIGERRRERKRVYAHLKRVREILERYDF